MCDMKRLILGATSLALLAVNIEQRKAGTIITAAYYASQTQGLPDGSFVWGPSPIITGEPIQANLFAAQGELMFDLSAIQAGSTITNAYLTLRLASVNSSYSQ